MEGFQVLVRFYAFVLGIFVFFRCHSSGKNSLVLQTVFLILKQYWKVSINKYAFTSGRVVNYLVMAIYWFTAMNIFYLDVYLYAVHAELDKSSCSHLREDGKPSNSEKLLLFSVGLFHPSHGFSRYIKSIFYFFDCDFHCDIKKVKILCFSSFLLNSFQPRINWQPFLCQLHDKWIFLPEYLQYWAESY